MRGFVWLLVVLLVVVHQDNWFWNDNTLVFGFMPIGLFYHACISVAASITWFLATRFAWPTVETHDPSNDLPGAGSGGHA